MFEQIIKNLLAAIAGAQAYLATYSLIKYQMKRPWEVIILPIVGFIQYILLKYLMDFVKKDKNKLIIVGLIGLLIEIILLALNFYFIYTKAPQVKDLVYNLIGSLVALFLIFIIVRRKK